MGKIVRYIKAYGIDSDGFELAPVDGLAKVAQRIEKEEPDTIVIIMAGYSGTISNWPVNDFTKGFDRLYPRALDGYYEWNEGKSE
jgi:hypothetical protein